MPRSEGIHIKHNAGSQRLAATLAGVDLDYRFCLVVAAAISLALTGGSQLELLVAALALLRTVWVRSRTGGPTPGAGPAKCTEAPPQQEPRVAPTQHHCGGDGHSPRAGDPFAVVVGGDNRPRPPRVTIRGASTLPHASRPQGVRGHDSRLNAIYQKYVETIMAHGHARQWQKALEVLTEMRQLSIEPNVSCFTALISACDKGKQPEKALELFDTMQKEGVQPNVVTYNALISACSNGKMPERAQEKFTEMQERGLTPNVVTYTSLIQAYWQSDHPQRAWEVFDAMKEAGEKPNIITFSRLLLVAQNCQDPEKCLCVFAEMERAGVAPSMPAYNTLQGCWRSQPLSRALKAIRIMQNNGEPPSKSAVSLVMSACDQGTLVKDEVLSTTAAHNPFAEMLQKGLAPDVVSYAGVIGACEKGRMPKKGLHRFQEMLDRGVSPDITCFNCAIRCCEQLGLAQKAMEVFGKMNEQQVIPDVDTYASLISVDGNGCTLVLDYFKEMQDRATCHAYNTAISACGRLRRRNGRTGVCIGMALDLFRNMKEAKVVPDAITYNALITVCDKRVCPWHAEEVFREMEANGPTPDVIAYNGLISCWAKSKKAETAMQLLEEMQSKGVVPNATTYSMLARACEKTGDNANMHEFKEKEAKCAC